MEMLVIGVGAVGSRIARMFEGRSDVMDFDIVEKGQMDGCEGRPKVECVPARRRFFEIFGRDTMDIVKDYDIVVDATDNLETKFLIAYACKEYGKRCIHIGVGSREIMVFENSNGCLQCLYRGKKEESCHNIPPERAWLAASLAWIFVSGRNEENLLYLHRKLDWIRFKRECECGMPSEGYGCDVHVFPVDFGKAVEAFGGNENGFVRDGIAFLPSGKIVVKGDRRRAERLYRFVREKTGMV